MPSVLDRLRRGHAPDVTPVRVPRDHIRIDTGAGFAGPAELVAGRHCLAVTLNGMRLAADREWATTYDPLVLTVTEVLYAGTLRRVPYLVSPTNVPEAPGEIPHGMRVLDTRVAGPVPYYGRLAVTTVLYRVVRDDYVRRTLSAVRDICDAVGGAAVTTALDVGDSVLEAVYAALGHDRIQPVLGHRVELHGPSVVPGMFLLAEGAVAEQQLWLEPGRVLHGPDREHAAALPGPHLVYSIEAVPPVDLSALPWFAPLWNQIKQWANIPEPSAKEVTKNYLAALYEEIWNSPDVPPEAVDEVYAVWHGHAMTIRAAAARRATWGPDDVLADPVRARVLAIRDAP